VRTCYPFSARRSYTFFFTKSRARCISWAYISKRLTVNTEYCCVHVEQLPLGRKRRGKSYRFFTVFNIYELRGYLRLRCVLPKCVLRRVCPTDYLRILKVLYANTRRRGQSNCCKEVIQLTFQRFHGESSLKVARNSERGDYMLCWPKSFANQN